MTTIEGLRRKTKPGLGDSGLRTSLLSWCQAKLANYPGITVESLKIQQGDSWQTGLAFAALVHAINPNAIDFHSMTKSNPKQNLEEAFEAAEENLSIPKMLDPEDILAAEDYMRPDDRCMYAYLSMFQKKSPIIDKTKSKVVAEHGDSPLSKSVSTIVKPVGNNGDSGASPSGSPSKEKDWRAKEEKFKEEMAKRKAARAQAEKEEQERKRREKEEEERRRREEEEERRKKEAEERKRKEEEERKRKEDEERKRREDEERARKQKEEDERKRKEEEERKKKEEELKRAEEQKRKEVEEKKGKEESEKKKREEEERQHQIHIENEKRESERKRIEEENKKKPAVSVPRLQLDGGQNQHQQPKQGPSPRGGGASSSKSQRQTSPRGGANQISPRGSAQQISPRGGPPGGNKPPVSPRRGGAGNNSNRGPVSPRGNQQASNNQKSPRRNSAALPNPPQQRQVSPRGGGPNAARPLPGAPASTAQNSGFAQPAQVGRQPSPGRRPLSTGGTPSNNLVHHPPGGRGGAVPPGGPARGGTSTAPPRGGATAGQGAARGGGGQPAHRPLPATGGPNPHPSGGRGSAPASQPMNNNQKNAPSGFGIARGSVGARAAIFQNN